MYPHELYNFIEERNFELGGDDLLLAISLQANPQLNHIKFNPYNNEYEMWDKYGNYYHFKVIPYEEAIERGLVRTRKR